MREQLRAGDLVIIEELDRLGRNYNLVKNEWNFLNKKGVFIEVLDTQLISTNKKNSLERQLIANVTFELLAYVAEKERIKIKRRQREGIALAKKKGAYKGRNPVRINQKKWDERKKSYFIH